MDGNKMMKNIANHLTTSDLMDNRYAIQDALFILLACIMLLVIFCVAWSSLDRLGWVRFVAVTPLPGRLKMILWGWY